MIVLRDYQGEAVRSLYPLKGKKLIVVPTGGGKSLIIASICQNEVLLGRVLVLTHVKELVEQNAKELHRLDNTLDLGVACAGLKRYEYDRQVTVASVQSIYKRLDVFDDVSCIIIDEAHRITPVGGKLYRAVLERFPNVPVIGLSATPFRMGTGYLHKGDFAIFDEKCYEVDYWELVERGFLVPPAKLGSDLAYDTSKLHVKMGEFIPSELDGLVEAEKTRNIVGQFIQRAADRESWLIFAINIRHAQMIKAMLEAQGISADVLYDGMEGDRDTTIQAFKLGLTRALINVNILTTGFDFPALDCVILCRPIASPVLFVQCVGRGTRKSPGKSDFLLLDYGGSCSRFGDFGSPEIREKIGAGPKKNCEECGEINSQAARNCGACGAIFPDMLKPCPKCKGQNDRSAQSCRYCDYHWPIRDEMLDENASTIVPNTAIWLDVTGATFKVHKPRALPERPNPQDCFCALYKTVDGDTIKEYVFPESFSARPKFEKWWIAHSGKAPVPVDVEATSNRRLELRPPKKIKVIRQGKFFNFLAREF